MTPSPPVYVLDAHALMVFFNAETGREVVRSVLTDHLNGVARATLSEINWGEIYSSTYQKVGEAKAEERLSHIDRLQISIEPVTRSLVKAAALIKAKYSTSKDQISYADCFAVALAQTLNGTIVTGDVEFKKVSSVVPVLWIPRKS